MSGSPEPAIDCIGRLVPATLRALYALELAGRHLAPDTIGRLAAAMEDREPNLRAALAQSRDTDWPERLQPVRACLEPAAGAAADAIAALGAALEAPQPIVAAYRAMRGYATAAEAIYPLSAVLKPVSQFFLEPSCRDDDDLVQRLAAVDAPENTVGVMHVGGPAGTRGAFSLYVPETYDPARAHPLIVALHGGSGNGGTFLWSWLREARSRGAILLAPTAIGTTWSLMDPDIDGPSINGMVDQLMEGWTVDPRHLLLTGMSDGGTFTYVLGLRAGCRFTHLAPIAAAFHPMLMTFADAARLRGLPLYIVHGAQDWMFPATLAQQAARLLGDAGAEVAHREIVDLAHTYPRDANAALLDWFLPT